AHGFLDCHVAGVEASLAARGANMINGFFKSGRRAADDGDVTASGGQGHCCSAADACTAAGDECRRPFEIHERVHSGHATPVSSALRLPGRSDKGGSMVYGRTPGTICIVPSNEKSSRMGAMSTFMQYTPPLPAS